jgi:DNA-directed RNA polymerase II subunit RPB1
MIETDGVDLQKVFSVPMVEFSRVISNDLIEIKDILGIEAARKCIVNEFNNVLSFYGIYVDHRHLSILCDIMTQKGKLTSITRHGINRLDTGPLRKCSFEETVEILLDAAVHNEVDNLKGVTENIMLGNLAPLGTGSFDINIDPECIYDNAQMIKKQNVLVGDEEQLGYLTPLANDDDQQIA